MGHPRILKAEELGTLSALNSCFTFDFIRIYLLYLSPMERERSKGNFVTRMSSKERKFVIKSTLFFGGMTMLIQSLSDVSLNRILVAGILDAIAVLV